MNILVVYLDRPVTVAKYFVEAMKKYAEVNVFNVSEILLKEGIH
ncbi:MAG: hypothetical protein QXJ14_04565 [Candidatus Aenigmatarchaeota archaeon]